jgi:hypothetical protein
MEQYFSRYLTVSDIRIFWSGLLGMIGITLETMCFFGVYRIIASVSESYAHVYRAGLIGMLAFGSFCHVMCCATIYYHNALYRIDPGIAIEETMKFAKYFTIPVSGIFFVFFLVMNIAQIMAFAKGKTPYPNWCWVFTMLTGIIEIAVMRLAGNRPLGICAFYGMAEHWKSCDIYRAAYKHAKENKWWSEIDYVGNTINTILPPFYRDGAICCSRGSYRRIVFLSEGCTEKGI